MKKVTSIGWDVGGWHGRKNAVSVIVFENGVLKLATPPKCITREILFDKGNDLPTFISKQINGDSKLIVAIDSPFGFPKTFTHLIADGKYTFTEVGDDYYDNMFAFRKTDKNIINKLGKKPISPSFDKLTNNITLAVNMLRILRKNDFVISPWDSFSQNDKAIAIEVYPGVFKCEKEKKLMLLKKMIQKVDIENKESQIFLEDLLSYYYKDVADDKSDEADSFICSLLGICFELKGELGLPIMQELPTDLDEDTKKEGWIFYPKDLERAGA